LRQARQGRLTGVKGKGGSERTVFLPADARRALDSLLDAAEQGPYKEEKTREHPRQYKPGQIRPLNPIPKFAPQREEE